MSPLRGSQRRSAGVAQNPTKTLRHRGRKVNRFVAYLRVSTQRQGRSGLGLEAQREAVARHVASVGGSILAEVVETESGKRVDRPELVRALVTCRAHKATLLIARLDRLARNVAFIAGLMETGVPFLACDMPTATPFMLHVYAAMAEAEGKAISARTKVALAAAKARGVKLGNPNLT
ncbi:MAG: recombinase family protein, partial [Myxococcaceae bacterium]